VRFTTHVWYIINYSTTSQACLFWVAFIEQRRNTHARTYAHRGALPTERHDFTKKPRWDLNPWQPK